MLPVITLLIAVAPPPHDERQILTDRPAPLPLSLPSEEEAFSFVVFGDRTGGPARGVEVLAEAVREVNWLGPDLVMTVGDLVEGYNSTPDWMAQMREFKGIMGGLVMPWFPVAGNHDVYWRGPDRPPEEHEGHFEQHFGPLWYAFEHKDCWFVVLYTDEPNPETGERNFDKAECQRMSEGQLAWLDSILAASSQAEHVFVFVHHPRWTGGKYGDDWERVHRRLVDAGNVSAVFGGHIHQMRYDPRDGIEYFALATVGGSQSEIAPRAGYLHEYHVVTVREDSVSAVAYPVGEALDPRAVTGTVSRDVRLLARELVPRFGRGLAVDEDGGAGGLIRFSLANPTENPVELQVRLTAEDREWRIEHDHVHGVLEPGESREFELSAQRWPSGIDSNFRLPQLHVAADYLTHAARFPLPEAIFPVPADVELPSDPISGVERVLDLSGDACATVASDSLSLGDGPFTLETWVRARRFAGRQGVVAKTENSEYGFFASGGRPEFMVHLDGAYVSVASDDPPLDVCHWYHLAGVFDESELRLYVDGVLVARAPASGLRTRNPHPLVIGGDVDGRGRPTSTLDGQLDGVRLSESVRYVGEGFEPQRHFTSDAETLLLLRMDRPFGPFLRDGSPEAAHATMTPRARVVPDE